MMPKLRIHLLGGLQVFSDTDRTFAIPTRKAQALLAYLARHPGQHYSRDKLASLLWEGSGEVQARASLRQALAALRRTLPLADEDLASGSRDSVTLNPDCAAVDAVEFESLADSDETGDLERAAALYQGELLEAFNPKAPAFEDWLMAERQRLREQAIDAMSRLLDAHIAAGATERAIVMGVRLLSLDPLQESVHRALMQLYARQGRSGSALKQFRVCRNMLQQQLGVRPESETEELFRNIQRQRHGQSRPLSAEEDVDGNELDPGTQAASTASTPEMPRSELRQVTILFAEMAEVTPIGSDGDLEWMQSQADRFVEIMREVVTRYGGTIDRDFGGKVMALFGFPVAHTDDIVRAVRAALDFRQAVRSQRSEGEQVPEARLGIADGQVLVTYGGELTGRAFAVTGDAAMVAAALAAAVRTDELLVADSTYGALSHSADGAEPTHVPRRDADKPLRAWRIDGLAERPISNRRRFVGRRAELGQLTGILEACRQTGRGLAIHLRGEAGIGKTRLTEEFITIAAEQGFACHMGRVLDFGAGKGQNAMRTIVGELLGLTPEGEEPDAAAIEKAVADGLVETNHEVHLYDLLQHAPPSALRALYDAMDNAARERGRREALQRMLHEASARQPRLIVIEDVHWADPPVLALAAALAAAVEACPAILVMTARPEGDPLSHGWHRVAGGGPLVAMHLGPLHREDVVTLVGELTKRSDSFSRQCIERCGGNPLFLEHLLRSDPSGSSGLPGSVQSVVMARTDGLDDQDRRALRAASVFGQRFSISALRHLTGISDYACDGLLEQGLVRPEGERDFLFSHALVREGVYASLPGSERRQLHRHAADWFSGHDPILLAQHLDRAEDPAAPRAYLEAATSQAAEYRYDRALQQVERGLALGGERVDRFALTCCRGEVLHDCGEITDAATAYEEAIALAEDDSERCRAWLGLAAVKRITGDLDGAFTDVEKAEHAAERLGLTEEAAQAHFLHGNLLFPRGDLEGCVRQHQRSLELARRQAGSAEIEASALGGLGDVEYMRGRMVTARERYRQCLELSERHGFGRITVANRSMVASMLWYAGDIEGMLAEALTAVEEAEKVGHLRAGMNAHMNACYARHWRMELDAALEHVETSLRLLQQLGSAHYEAFARAYRAAVRRTAGRRSEALVDLDDALAVSRRTGMAFVGPWILGILAVTTEDEAIRNNALAEGEALLASNSIAHNHLHFRREAIEVCLGCGNWNGARHHAAALEGFVRQEPLPWTTFFIERGRALAAHGEGKRDEGLVNTLERVRDEGERFGYRIAIPPIEAALNA